MKTAIIIILAAGIILLLVFTPKRQTTSEERATKAAQEYLLQKLDDPDSYKPGKFVVDKNGSGWDVDHDFRAKNKFGALINKHMSFYVDSTYKVTDAY